MNKGGVKKLSLSFFTPPTACGKIHLNFDNIKDLTDQVHLKNAETPTDIFGGL